MMTKSEVSFICMCLTFFIHARRSAVRKISLLNLTILTMLNPWLGYDNRCRRLLRVRGRGFLAFGYHWITWTPSWMGHPCLLPCPECCLRQCSNLHRAWPPVCWTLARKWQLHRKLESVGRGGSASGLGPCCILAVRPAERILHRIRWIALDNIEETH